MTNIDSYLLAIGLVIFLIAYGVFIGKALDDQDIKKNWIIAFFDGYLLVTPIMIMATGIGLFLPVYGAVMLIYSIIKFLAGEFILNDYTGAGIAFALFASVFCFWWWFRSKVLKIKDLF